MKMFQKNNKAALPSLWKSGQLLTFSGLEGSTDFRLGLCARTCSDTPGLEIVLPGKCRIRFGRQILSAELLADAFRIETEQGEVVGVFCDAHHLRLEGPCEIVNHCEEITAVSNNGSILIGVKPYFNPALLRTPVLPMLEERRNWLLRKLAAWNGCPADQRRVLARAVSVLKTQVYSPEGQIRHYWTTPDRWPHRGMWLWDSAFHSIGWRHLDIKLARQMLRAVLDVQAEDGRIPHMATPYSATAITQPPVLCLAAAKLRQVQEDRAWLEQIYPALCRYVEWDLTNRDSDGFGLAEWFIDNNDPNCRSGESGMDNSPRFDGDKSLDAVDFNAYLAGECEQLSRFAADLGKPEDNAHWSKRYEQLCEKINRRFWDDASGFYYDCEADTGRRSEVMAGSGFLPLLCGAATEKQARRLADHLTNPAAFGKALPVPTVSASQPQFYSKDMWRGPTWVNLNWMIAEGFSRYGLDQAARLIRSRTLREIERYCEKYGTFFEFYDDRCEVDPPNLLRKRKNDPAQWVHQVIFDYGWTAALYIDMLSLERTAE